MTTTETTIVGTYTIPEPRKHNYSISETASRYEEVLLTPGTYEVHAAYGYTDRSEVRLFVEVPGVVTSRYDGAEFCGNRIGSSPQYDRHPDVGKERTVTLAVFLGDVTLNETGLEVLCVQWVTGLRNNGENKLDGHGLTVDSHQVLRWRELVVYVSHACQEEGELIEFFQDPYTLAEAVNRHIRNGRHVDVWDVATNWETRKITGLYPRFEHVPYKERRDLRDAARAARHR